jgi:hypothetical protein
LILSIITAFFFPKVQNILKNSDLITLKSQIALIQNGIKKQKTKNILLQKDEKLSNLDSAKSGVENEKLFSNILDETIFSTTNSEKKSGFWAKISDSKYLFFVKDDIFEFAFDGYSFICTSKEELCKSLE